MSEDNEFILPVGGCGNSELPPSDTIDPVVEFYKKDVDRTLLRENLKLTVGERLKKYQAFADSAEQLKEAGRLWRAKNP